MPQSQLATMRESQAVNWCQRLKVFDVKPQTLFGSVLMNGPDGIYLQLRRGSMTVVVSIAGYITLMFFIGADKVHHVLQVNAGVYIVMLLSSSGMAFNRIAKISGACPRAG